LIVHFGGVERVRRWTAAVGGLIDMRCLYTEAVGITIGLKPKYRAKLSKLAAGRDEKDHWFVIVEAIESHLQRAEESDAARRRPLRVCGSLSPRDADALRRATETIGTSWR
jgi:hypothetical protein